MCCVGTAGVITALNRHVLHLGITAYDAESWVFCVVYNPQLLEGQIKVWSELSKIARLKLPWLVAGDFNAIANTEEHRGGLFNHYAAKSNYFNDFVCFSNLIDLGFLGSAFTWCNGQSGCSRRWARLDRFMANVEWLEFFDSYSVKHLQRISSNHAPLSLKTRLRSHAKKKIFRFENVWFDHKGCHDSVVSAWNFNPNSSPLHAFSHLVHRTRHKIIS